jgi:phage tail-like protein
VAFPAVVKTSLSRLQSDPLRNFKFQVNIKQSVPPGPAGGNPRNLAELGFTSVSGLSVTTESIPYRQGGFNTSVQNIPGQTSFTPVTLQRGAIIGTDHSWQWARQLFSVIAGAGTGTAAAGVDQDFRADVEILVLDHPVTKDGTPDNQTANTDVKLAVLLHNAWITALSYSDFNAGDNALLVEQMTLVHEGFEMNWGSYGAGESHNPRQFAPVL